MTIVEFFDENCIENIVSMLICSPEKIILVGNNRKKMEKCGEAYRQIGEARGINSEISCKSVNKNDLQSIVTALSDIAENSDDLIFDLTGGDDLYLVATGMVYEKYKSKISLHRYNVKNGRMIDCDADGRLIANLPAQISADENMRVYGGRIIYSDEKAVATYRWNYTEDFKADVMALWNIVKDIHSGWNAVITSLEGFMVTQPASEELEVRLSKASVESFLSARAIRSDFVNDMLYSLNRKGLIKNLKHQDGEIIYNYKDLQIKRLLTKAGTSLELYVTVLAMDIREKDEPFYNDVMNGVFVDWDGMLSDESPDVENEIDVMLIKDMMPIFISCKNGNVSVDELYKIQTVAQRFGGIYAKKALVVTELDKESLRGEYLTLRAKEMDITLIDNVCDMDDKEVAKAIKELWRK